MTAMQRALSDIAASLRESRREYAENMPVDSLINWLTTDSFCKPVQRAARWVMAEPNSPEASRLLMRAVMGQLRRTMGKTVYERYLRHANATELHNAFRAVARINKEQRP